MLIAQMIALLDSLIAGKEAENRTMKSTTNEIVHVIHLLLVFNVSKSDITLYYGNKITVKNIRIHVWHSSNASLFFQSQGQVGHFFLDVTLNISS